MDCTALRTGQFNSLTQQQNSTRVAYNLPGNEPATFTTSNTTTTAAAITTTTSSTTTTSASTTTTTTISTADV